MKETEEGLPWWSWGKDSVLPMQGVWVRSLIKELRSHSPAAWPKKKKKKRERERDRGKIHTYRMDKEML